MRLRQGFDPLLLDVLDWGPLDDNVGRDSSLRDELKVIVDELPEPERTVVEGIFWEQVPLRELARRLKMSRSRCNTTLNRALELLSEKLKEQP